MSLLSARGLHKVFGTGETSVAAVQGVDLDVQEGEFVAIVGPSGSGKSTLLHLLGGVEPPTNGEILFDGRNLAKLDNYELSLLRRRRFGFVFQKLNLLPALSAAENVALPLILDGFTPAAAKTRALEALELAVIAQRATQGAGTLSGGEQQRVAIARALVIKPALIFADEPTGALDTANSQRISQLLRELVTKHQQTLVMVTHDHAVAGLADRCLFYRDGKVEKETRLEH